MKKYLLALLTVIPILTACPPKEVLPTSVTLNKTSLTLVEGADFTLQSLVNPADAVNKEVTWSSSAEAVATVDQTGKVVAVKEGKATITATSKAASSVKGTCEVTVTKKAIPVEAVQLSESDPVSLVPDETLQLSAVITPSNATDNIVTWASDNTSVATVDANGLVTAISGGVAYITATAGGKTSDALMVTVLEPKPLLIRYPYCLLRTGGSITQEVWYGTTFADRDKDNMPVVEWKSSNDAIATPDGGNVIRSVGPGTATITGKDAAGGKISFTVVVEDRPDRQYDDYLPGIPLVNCHDNSAKWSCTDGEYALSDGYSTSIYTTEEEPLVLDTQTQCMTVTETGYKVAEVFFDKRIDVSSIKNPALFIRMYIEDISKFVTLTTSNGSDNPGEPIVEIRSTDPLGTYEETNNRVYWSLADIFTNMDKATPKAKQELHSGWNNIVLPFEKATAFGLNGPDYNLTNLTYFRFHLMDPRPPLFVPNYVPTVYKFDQIRIIDWTEFEACDNFAMWRDRPAQQSQYSYYDDSEEKVQGRSSVACKDVLLNAVNSLRLEMWPGLEYSIPAVYNIEDLAFQCKFWIDDPAHFTEWYQFNFELSSHFTPDHNGFDFAFGKHGDPWPFELHEGWNTLKFNFEDVIQWLKVDEAWDPHRICYFRLILTPIQMPNANVSYHTYRIDDIRIVPKD